MNSVAADFDFDQPTSEDVNEVFGDISASYNGKDKIGEDEFKILVKNV